MVRIGVYNLEFCLNLEVYSTIFLRLGGCICLERKIVPGIAFDWDWDRSWRVGARSTLTLTLSLDRVDSREVPDDSDPPGTLYLADQGLSYKKAKWLVVLYTLPHPPFQHSAGTSAQQSQCAHIGTRAVAHLHTGAAQMFNFTPPCLHSGLPKGPGLCALRTRACAKTLFIFIFIFMKVQMSSSRASYRYF